MRAHVIKLYARVSGCTCARLAWACHGPGSGQMVSKPYLRRKRFSLRIAAAFIIRRPASCAATSNSPTKVSTYYDAALCQALPCSAMPYLPLDCDKYIMIHKID